MDRRAAGAYRLAAWAVRSCDAAVPRSAPRSGDDGSDSARYWQAGRAALGTELRLHTGRPIARAYHAGHRDDREEGGADSGLSAAAQTAGGTHGAEPSWEVRVWLAEAADDARGGALPLPR